MTSARSALSDLRVLEIGDLPAGVVMQWRRWCLNPKYSVGAEGEAVRKRYAAATFPVLALSITDDELMTLRGTHSLVDLYENTRREVQRIAPSACGVRRLGHFGPFRREHEAALWPGLAQRLAGFSAAA